MDNDEIWECPKCGSLPFYFRDELDGCSFVDIWCCLGETTSRYEGPDGPKYARLCCIAAWKALAEEWAAYNPQRIKPWDGEPLRVVGED